MYLHYRYQYEKFYYFFKALRHHIPHVHFKTEAAGIELKFTKPLLVIILYKK